MKRIYIKPVVEAVAIHTSSLICASIVLSSESQNNDVALGRDFDFDLDEEEYFDDEEEYFDDEEEY